MSSRAAGKPGYKHHEILWTDKYDLFVLHNKNRTIRPTIVKKKVRLLESKGWCPGCPIVCCRIPGGKLEVYDGQHRLEAAKILKMPVPYCVVDRNGLEPCDLNSASAQKPWTISDHIESYVNIGNKEYIELRDYCQKYNLPPFIAASLLMGHVAACGARNCVHEGEFKVSDREYAVAVAEIIQQIAPVFSAIKGNVYIGAIARFVLVKDFKASQLIDACLNHRSMLHGCATVDQAGAMFEDIYNYNRRYRIPLKFKADEIVRERSFGTAALRLRQTV